MKHPRELIAPAVSGSTPSAEERARQKYRRKRRFVRIGQVLMLAGVVVGIVHWLTHLEAFGPEQPALWLDLVAGYPMAAVLLIVGGIVAGKK
ncbi:hypothetical protein [Cryobacterium sp. TMS1-13-1]|uniref:hypothetical protein n=1 Tax=Cryobacterium sp. TMS1-13-1 TaxID=1259220 RepID=UPI001F5483CB|nr:hypothetical protein [Cryobacterium sp. TMS1-13-1]